MESKRMEHRKPVRWGQVLILGKGFYFAVYFTCFAPKIAIKMDIKNNYQKHWNFWKITCKFFITWKKTLMAPTDGLPQPRGHRSPPHGESPPWGKRGDRGWAPAQSAPERATLHPQASGCSRWFRIKVTRPPGWWINPLRRVQKNWLVRKVLGTALSHLLRVRVSLEQVWLIRGLGLDPDWTQGRDPPQETLPPVLGSLWRTHQWQRSGGKGRCADHRPALAGPALPKSPIQGPHSVQTARSLFKVSLFKFWQSAVYLLSSVVVKKYN